MRWIGSMSIAIGACAAPGQGGIGGDDDPAVADATRDAVQVDASSTGELPAFCAAYPPATRGAASAYVFYGDDGRLRYAPDERGHRITDFGAAGYRGGAATPPVVAELARIGPDDDDGDDTARIQAALDALPGPGALVLDPGSYEIAGTLRVRASGVVLRGAGDGGDPRVDTILRATGDTPHQRTVIVVGGDGVDWRDPISGSEAEITSPLVRAGERSFDVDHPERLHAGDRVVVLHPSTPAWIDALDGGGAQAAWTPGELDIPYLRRVVAIDGATVTLDAPVHADLDRALSRSTIYAVDDAGLVREAGVEHLRVDIVTAGGEDEDHAWNAIDVAGAEDAWVRDVTALHFGYAGVRVHDADRVSVLDVRALEPVAIATGGRMYNFAADGFAQQVLFADCEASRGRHSFVANGASSTSGVVFLRGRTTSARGTSEGHRRWSQALLYDGIVEDEPEARLTVGLYNRGDWGTQHGWAAVHSVLWRHDTGGKLAIVQAPPTAQNWAIGTIGGVTADGPFEGPPGLAEAVDGELEPRSLYEAQLCDRLRE